MSGTRVCRLLDNNKSSCSLQLRFLDVFVFSLHLLLLIEFFAHFIACNLTSTMAVEGGSLGFSFKMATKAKSKVTTVASRLEGDDGRECESTEFVTSIDDCKIQSTIPVIEKGDLVIPLIKNNNWRLAKMKQKYSEIESWATEDDGPKTVPKPTVSAGRSNGQPKTEVINLEETIEDIAKRELIADANRDNEEWDNRGSKSNTKVIPIFLENAVPGGIEGEDNFDVSARADDPTAEDYERVPVQEFGLAMLRGMGWKPEASDGKKFVAPIEVVIRPKGLGLGAEVPMKKQKINTASTSSAKKVVEDLELKRDCPVYIGMGEFKGYYGKVESFDDDMVRATVRLVLTDMAVTVPVAVITVVSNDEFKKEGKVINKSTYEEFKVKAEEKKKLIDKSHRTSRESEKNSNRDRDRNSSNRNSDNDRKSFTTSNGKLESGASVSWLMPNLRVRLIDTHYKRGKYYKEKITITDVLTPKSCICRTDDKITLEDIKLNMLETVVPRSDNSRVMVLRGDHKRELAIMLERNKDKCIASVQLLADRSKVIKLDYDDICEYVGDYVD